MFLNKISYFYRSFFNYDLSNCCATFVAFDHSSAVINASMQSLIRSTLKYNSAACVGFFKSTNFGATTCTTLLERFSFKNFCDISNAYL
jgi:hypothetical protein